MSAEVGIGLPVFNNERHLPQMLESLREQTHRDFVVYLSDDCSTDATPEICSDYAARDLRFRFERNTVNLGPTENLRKVLALADTPYFMFARGHEILPRALLAKCLECLKAEQGVVLAFTRSRWIDEEGQERPDKPFSAFDTRGMDVVGRSVLAIWSRCELFYGLTRTEAMRAARPLEEMVGHDHLMILEMALMGEFALVDAGFRLRRYHYAQESYRQRIERYKEVSFRDLGPLGRAFPLGRLPAEFLRAVARSSLTPGEKAAVSVAIAVNSPFRFLASRGKGL